ncbi:MAG TPA: SGNH/GDSL hydrolase family protein [Myxococcota bacterium]|nr:SGNH/GDSL hydrolase family protein [Myxococcota bacterium]
MTRLRSLLGALALALVATALTLGGAELAVRVVASLPRPAPPSPDPELEGLPQLKGVFELSRPNVVGIHQGTLWRTNSAGFRGPERSLVPPPGVFRIAVVGDSFSAGQGVREDDAYAAQLERLLNRSGSQRFEVLNVGLGGLNAEYVLDRADRVAAKFRPHLYVYGFTLNDIEEIGWMRRSDGERYRAIGKEMLRFAGSRSYLLRALWPRWVSLRDLWFPREGVSYAEELASAYRDPAKFARIEHALDGFVALGERSGACVHVLIHTELTQLRFWHPFRDAYDRVERAAKARGLTATQSFPAHRWHSTQDLRVSPLDGHPNREGHRILAEALYAGLRELPPHCGFPSIP